MSVPATNDKYDDLFDKYGQIYNVDPALGKTLFHVESSGNPNAPRGGAGEEGGMQITPGLAAHYGIDPRDMKQAVPAAMAYLAEGLQATGGDPAGAVAYYNGGPKTLQRILPSTQAYVAKAQSYYPRMNVTNLAGPMPAGEASPPPIVVADASRPSGDDAFKSRWGLSDGAPPAAPDDTAFRNRWGLNPANTNAPAPAAAPALVSDSAASAPAPPAAPQMGAPGTAANGLGGDQFIPNPLASNPSQGNYAGLRSALEPAPNTTYGTILPYAKDTTTGDLRFALPAPLRTLAQGAVDLAYGPQTGIVTPEATAALATGVLARPGLMRSPANIPGRFSVFPGGAPSPAVAAANPLASPAVAAPPPEGAMPSFGTAAGRTFDVDAQGNVIQTGASLVPAGGGPEAAPIANPLATTSAPSAPAANPLSTAAPVAARGAGKAVTLSPVEQRLVTAINGPNVQPPSSGPMNILGGLSAPASGAAAGPPPGAPPLGTPGYTPTTPGVSPQAVAAMSPAEAAIHAATKDTPPPAPMIPPQTQKAADALADQVIRYFHAGKPPLAPADVAVPPGYHPSLTGLTNDPGLATLHRGMESVSSAPAMLADSNAQAINAAAQRLTGQPGDADLMQAQVNATTTPMREAAFANKTDMDPEKTQAAIDAANKILAGPDSKRPGVVKYVTQVRDSLLDAHGKPETDPEMAYGAHKAINDLLSPLAQSTDADKQAASASLMKLKPLVQIAIESGAGGFKDYMATHADLMKPVNAQRYLESLNLTNATGDTRLAAVDSAIKSITKQQAAPGISKAEWVSPDQLDQLTALRNALRMEASRGAGKPINSTTFQNLATNSRVSQIAGNPLSSILAGQLYSPGIPGAIAGYAGKTAIEANLARSRDMVSAALLRRLLNVNGEGEAVLARPAPASGPRASRPGPGAPWNMPNPLSSGPPPTP